MQTGFPRERTGAVAAAFAVQREMDEKEGRVMTRTAKELIALGDQHFDRFSDKEMNVLFQHLQEANIGSPQYDEGEWVMLQIYLRGSGIPITVFPGYVDGCGVPEEGKLSNLFHRVWTKHRDGYRKIDWKVFHNQLSIRKIFV